MVQTCPMWWRVWREKRIFTQTVFQALSSVYDTQILIATHSPLILGLASLDDLLCFGRTEEGATDIVAGREHPRLRDWQGTLDLSTLFAAGVLG